MPRVVGRWDTSDDERQCCSHWELTSGKLIEVGDRFTQEAFAFIDDLLEEQPVARPAKRQRVQGPIEVYGDELVVSKRSALVESSTPSRHLSRPNVGVSLHLNHAEAAGGAGLNLLLSCCRRLDKESAFCLSIHLPDGIPEPIRAFIDFGDMVPRTRKAGNLTMLTDLDLRLEGGEAVLSLKFRLLLEVGSASTSPSTYRWGWVRKARNLAFEAFMPAVPLATTTNGSPQDFYRAAHITEPDYSSMHIPGLAATLYPFQRRAVRWMLGREGVQWHPPVDGASHGTIAPFASQPATPVGYTELQDVDGQEFYISEFHGVTARDDSGLRRDRVENEKGGILAEEMGLGKTLEILGLILLNRRPSAPDHVVNVSAPDANLELSGATLIITPETLRDQWASELLKHAPRLRVMVYRGMRKVTKKHVDAESEAALVAQLADHDVVIMTYNELRSEIHYAIPPPDRSRRRERKYHRPLSPLMRISWWRVCLDEAQEIDSGVGHAAQLAQMIPRVNAWAVTGTPIKDDLKDLRGLLLFLHSDFFVLPNVWDKLVSYQGIFRHLFRQISLRHTKHLVRGELELPAQKRYVINIPFNAVEEQYYQRLFRSLVKACELNDQGEPTTENWRPEEHTRVMRNCLDLLRKAALHPQVGARGHTAGRNPLRTVTEVLDFMLQEADSNFLTSQRALLALKLTRGQLFEETPRKKEALEIWQEVLDTIEPVIGATREEIRIAQSSAADDDADDTSDEEEKAGNLRLREAQRKLRYSLEIQHKAIFFRGNVYFQIRTDNDMTDPEDKDEIERLSKLEEECYARAKRVRQEILQDSHQKASKLMARIEDKAKRQDFAVIPNMECDIRPGIETSMIVDMTESLCAALNEQADQLDGWRQRLIELVCKPLVDEDEDVEVTGDEYGDSTKVQEEMIVFVQVIRTALADRHAALSGQPVSKLVVVETKASIAQALEGEGPAPELLIELFDQRARVSPTNCQGSVRSLLGDLRTVSASLKHQNSDRAQAEQAVVEQLQQKLTAMWNKQSKAQTVMEQEVDLFTSIMNIRVEYYRQLQAISDDLAPYQGAKDDGARALTSMEAQEKTLSDKIAKAQAEHRYLLNLKGSGDKDEIRMCPICQTEITNGVITTCGHQFDKDCLLPWLSRAGNCPTCKRPVRPFQLHPFTLKPQQLKLMDSGDKDCDAAGGTNNDGRKPSSPKSKNDIYSSFNAEKLAEIKAVELDGPSYTTKVDAIVRHLLWLRESDPGAKSIIFSQYTDFFKVLSDAFDRYRIGFSSISDRAGIQRFTEDPGIECFLLHARAQSSGLNLVNANHVILCEPLLNTALELQAIARVDRIGQQQDTTVWLYIVEGTVEESIYNLSVQRRLEHMDRNLKGKAKGVDESSLEIANALEMEQASLTRLMRKREGGEEVGEEIAMDDLWTCIFGHVGRRGADNDGRAAAAAGEGVVVDGGEDEELAEEIRGHETRLRNEPAIRRRLLADAAEERRRNVVVIESDDGSD
ncbi:ATP-dependent DNA helicase [Gaeumannomyces tritici R3-111a-1]|uniref:ATP-dependent DNA helicase n=1 Tax=Gaeumannomyces tritici (strain R3-111a-1) TaxID=644352 RepID=J3NMZ2_GAET3|nr:ATP-dependent DNA helicase [Gaeumannomyces tritici R3-111a-1]EJT77544.1 ATP-dependent DNA helicase [Gaeumannomyces tritici R3-111a-1]